MKPKEQKVVRRRYPSLLTVVNNPNEYEAITQAASVCYGNVSGYLRCAALYVAAQRK